MVDPRDRARRASSFAGVADAYERSRPGYPVDAVRWLVGGEPGDVLDLGAGTGKLTRSLVALGHRVTAVEPLPEMLEQLRAALPGIEVALGSAEVIPLPDASVDVVTCAQAFHWFDHDRALVEIARVLRPGGRLALVWNTRDEREPWVDELSDAMVGRTGVDHGVAAPIASSGLFGPVEEAEFDHVQELDRVGVARARALAELLRDPDAGGACADPREGRCDLRPALAGRDPPPSVRHRVLPRREALRGA